MSDKLETRGFLLAILAGVILIVVLAFVGLRLEDRLGSIESQLQGQPASDPPLQKLESTPEKVAAGQTGFVPAYSHVNSFGERELSFETTLSIRNTDPNRAIVIESVRYYDTAGEMIHQYQGKPAVLGPRAAADYLFERGDRSGGVNASFLVEWVAEEEVNEPVIEAMMISTSGSWAMSFVRPGHPIVHVPQGE